MNLSWKSAGDVSALHAARCLDRYAADCHRASPELAATALELATAGRQLSFPPDRFWELLISLCVDTPNSVELAERIALRSPAQAQPTSDQTSRLAAALSALKSQYARDYPNFESEMHLREEPLRQQWEAYGPGLLRLMAEFSQATLMVEQAQVILVQPVVGGDGMPHLTTNRCHIEAVLTNVDPRLHETLRLAWLLSQLNLERPAFSQAISAFRLLHIAGLAMLAPTLKAAQELDLCAFDADTLQEALRLWRIAPPDHDRQHLAHVLLSWWETVETDRPDWAVAMAGLDRLVE